MSEPSRRTASKEMAAFDRRLDERLLRQGSQGDQPCPHCGKIGFRLVATSEMVLLYACRQCGHQREVAKEGKEEEVPPFREYRETRGLRAALDEEGSGTS